MILSNIDAAVHGLMLRADKISQEQFMHGVGADSYNLVTIDGTQVRRARRQADGRHDRRLLPLSL